MRRLALALCLGASLLGSGAAAQGPLGPPAASLTLESTSVAVGIGVSWGSGVLTLDGVQHRFKVSGLSVVDVGASKVTAAGEVWGLTDLSQFDGTYYGADVGAAVGGGEGQSCSSYNSPHLPATGPQLHMNRKCPLKRKTQSRLFQ